MSSFQLPKLLEHQEIVSEFIVTRANSGVFLGVGGGKTNTVLASLFKARPQGHILVVAPKNIARSTWLDEIDKWSYPIRTKSLIVNEQDKLLNRKQRLALYEQIPTDPPTMYFINQDLIDDLVKNMPVIKMQNGRTPSGRIRYKQSIQWPFATIVIDESQGFKNPSSTRFKALTKIQSAVERMILLTGTPTPNGLLDLWAQVYLLDQGQALGQKFSEYRERYFTADMFVDGRAVRWKINGASAEAEIYAKIKHLVMSAKNVTLPLPPVSYTEYKVRMDPDLHQAYKDFATQSVLDIIPQGTSKPEAREIIAANAGALRTKLLQFASGTLYLDEFDDSGNRVEIEDTQLTTIKGKTTAYELLHSAKIEMLDYLIRNTGGSPTMVAYRYRSDQAELTRQLTKLGHTVETFDGSRAMVAKWNAGLIPIMLLQPASAGHGLNLQDGGHDLVWYTLPDSLEHWVQTNGRLYRIGQKHPVNISYLTTHGTLDTRQPAMLAIKQDAMDRLVDAVEIDSGNAHSMYASSQLLEELDAIAYENIEDEIGGLDNYPY